MIAKKLCNTLLLSSALFLTACGGGSGGASESNNTNQAELSHVTADLKSIQDQTDQVLTRLNQANQDVVAKKQVLDALQEQLAIGKVDETAIAAAQAAYDRASSEVASQEQQKIALADQARKLKEKIDTVTAAVKLDSALNNVGSAVLSGTFSQADFDTLLNAVNTKSAVQLVAPANKFITDIKFGLSSGAKVRAAVPKLINSPIFDSLVIPFMAQDFGSEVQPAGEYYIREFGMLADSPEGSDFLLTYKGAFMTIPYKKTETANVYTLSFPLNKAIKDSTRELQYQLTPTEYQGVLAFIDNYFRDNPARVTEVVNLKLKVGDPKVLQSDVQQLFMKLKPVVSDVINKMPDKWLGWLAELIQKTPNVDVEDMEEFKKDVAGFVAQGLSAGAPISTSGNTAYRKARFDTGGGVGFDQFVIDGHSVDQSYVIDMPLRVDLKGSLTSGKTTNVIGSVTYNLNGTVVGMVQSYNNAVDLHAETSVLLSQSIGNFFIEGQAGFVGVREGLFSGWEGQRYQATFGYDAAYVSPFVQFEYRPLTNGFSTLDATGVYVGLESGMLIVHLPEATLTSSVLAKVGYESTTETMFGQSLKSNQTAAAFVEWNGALKLSQGLEVKSALTLGSKDQSVKLNVAFEQ